MLNQPTIFALIDVRYTIRKDEQGALAVHLQRENGSKIVNWPWCQTQFPIDTKRVQCCLRARPFAESNWMFGSMRFHEGLMLSAKETEAFVPEC